jgi:hypothetical protein
MIVTNDFVMLNLPKTGSSFARAVIKEIYEHRQSSKNEIIKALQRLIFKQPSYFSELMLPNIRVSGIEKPANQHGTFSQIPPKYLNREIVSIVRNPYSRFMSSYEFREWEKYPLIPESFLAEHFPHFPSLSVDDYVRLEELQVIHGMFGGNIPKANVGNQTVQFIQMFFRNPRDVLANLTDEYLNSRDIFYDIADIHFLRQDRLSDDLALFLERHGFSAEEVQYVRERERVNVTKSCGIDRACLWTKSSIAYVKEKERMIFSILNNRGIFYPTPEVIVESQANEFI